MSIGAARGVTVAGGAVPSCRPNTVVFRQDARSTRLCLVFVNPDYRQNEPVPSPRRPGDSVTLRKLGRALKTERVAAGVTQERLAEKVGLSTRTYQAVEAGEINVPITTLLRLAKAIGVPAEKLIRELS